MGPGNPSWNSSVIVLLIVAYAAIWWKNKLHFAYSLYIAIAVFLLIAMQETSSIIFLVPVAVILFGAKWLRDSYWKDTAKKKILIVIEDPDMLKTISDSLEMNEYEVITAPDAGDPIVKIIRHVPDLIIVEYNMSAGSEEWSSELIKLMESLDQTAKIPIIFIRGEGQNEEPKGRRDIDWAFTKPIELSVLLGTVETIVY